MSLSLIFSGEFIIASLVSIGLVYVLARVVFYAYFTEKTNHVTKLFKAGNELAKTRRDEDES